MGSGLGEHVKIWDHQFISATVEANNFKFGIQLGLGNPLFISATVEASKFKFGTQVGLGE